jgi:hypothetical protein
MNQEAYSHLLAGLAKIARIADVTAGEVINVIVEDFLTDLEYDPDILVTSQVSQSLLTTRLFQTKVEAEAAAARYNALADQIKSDIIYDGSRARVSEAISEAQQVEGYWIEIND